MNGKIEQWNSFTPTLAINVVYFPIKAPSLGYFFDAFGAAANEQAGFAVTDGLAFALDNAKIWTGCPNKEDHVAIVIKWKFSSF